MKQKSEGKVFKKINMTKLKAEWKKQGVQEVLRDRRL